MKAPEKIYVIEQEAARGTILLASAELNDFAEQNNAKEYIRADAFMEKALDYIENNIYDHYDGGNEYGVCGGYVKKEEFIENFKNYMKEK